MRRAFEWQLPNVLAEGDNNEADWELLTTTSLEGSDTVPAGVWATNQALQEGGQSTSVNVPFDFDPAADYHEYRIDVSFRAQRARTPC